MQTLSPCVQAYPIPPHLNHLGNDMCRGLLMFDQGKMLGREGLYWLKLQTANLWGQDKLSNDERVAFVDASGAAHEHTRTHIRGKSQSGQRNPQQQTRWRKTSRVILHASPP